MLPLSAWSYCSKLSPSCEFNVGMHNSYHISPSENTLGALILLGDTDTAAAINYTHPTLEAQFAAGLTTFEIDVFADPSGGLFKSPGVVAIKTETVPSDYATIMSEPGFKVMLIQDVDIQTHCYTLASCIAKLMALSRTKTTYVLLEIKTATPPFPEEAPFQPTTALKMDDALWAALEAEVSAASSATPPIKFLLDGEDDSADYIAYVAGKATPTKVLVPNLEDMTAVPTGWSKTDTYVSCNDVTVAGPCALGSTAKELVEADYLVRAISDGFPNWKSARASATLASGAQIIHTDYPDKLKMLIESESYVCGSDSTMGTQVWGMCSKKNKIPTLGSFCTGCSMKQAACPEDTTTCDEGQVCMDTSWGLEGYHNHKCITASFGNSSRMDEDDPCFARDTFAVSPDGESIPMASLKSGDLVMDGPGSVARVIVNQHREATFKSSLLEITHANGELSLTPDHVLEVDGVFVPARLASAGTMLGDSEVSRVTVTAGEVINPLTTSGKILTQGGVLATTYPEWVAEYMLSSRLVPLPISLSNLLSYVFPETTQAYYDAVIEPLVTKAHPKHLKAALPAPLLPAAFLFGDLALASGFAGFALASPMVLVAAAAVALAAKARK